MESSNRGRPPADQDLPLDRAALQLIMKIEADPMMGYEFVQGEALNVAQGAIEPSFGIDDKWFALLHISADLITLRALELTTKDEVRSALSEACDVNKSSRGEHLAVYLGRKAYATEVQP